jgi:uncharacterized protein YjbI with pentapeptide repeats
MQKDYSYRNNKKVSFRNEDLNHTSFYGSDLRGVDFSGADLSCTRFINVKTGITPVNTFLFFLTALLLSALSGYIASLAGRTVQTMLASQNLQIRIIGIATIVIIIFFIVYAYWKGGAKAITQLMVPIFFFSILVGGISYFSGAGTGMGMLYELFALLLLVIMFIAGTIARVAVGNMSNILFLIVALTGGLVSKSVGGGIGTAVMAISCALISKRALSGAKGFETMKKMATFFTVKFGTSFRNSRLVKADFSQSGKIRNCDFSHADISLIHWGDCKKLNCIP